MAQQGQTLGSCDPQGESGSVPAFGGPWSAEELVGEGPSGDRPQVTGMGELLQDMPWGADLAC